jgi:hypothetical protein
MSNFKLKRISATDSHLYIQADQEVFIGNTVSPASNPLSIANKSNFICVDDTGQETNFQFSNIRPSIEFRHQSPISVNHHGERLKEYLPHETKLSAIVQIEDTISAITNLVGSKEIFANKYLQESSKGVYPYTMKYWKTNFTVPNNSTNIAKFYPIKKSYYVTKSGQRYYDLNGRARYRLFDNISRRIVKDRIVMPEYALDGMVFNYLTEIDTFTSMASPLFIEKINYTNSTTLKNMYDDKYGCEIDITLDTLDGDVSSQFVSSAKLSGAREYVNAGKNSTVMWVSYKNNLSYLFNATAAFYELPTTSEGEDGTLYELDDYRLYEIDSDRIYTKRPGGYDIDLIGGKRFVGTATDLYKTNYIPVMRTQDDSNQEHLKYEYIETIAGTNKLQLLPKHKSNMYSIEIRNSGILTNESLTEDMKNRIKTSINNIISSAVKNITPAYTQLIDIRWTGS